VNNNYSGKRRYLYYITVVIIFLLISSLFIKWINCQENIVSTPEEIIKVFKNSGYEIENIQYLNENDKFPGMFASAKSGARFSFIFENQNYDVLVVIADNFIDAKRGVRIANELDSEMNGGFGYSFCYGRAIVQIYPSDKTISKKILEALITENNYMEITY